jgi:type IV pilus assembly protein PilX
MRRLHLSAARQTGSALIVALVFLLLMTLLGTSAMQGSTMQERMASNWRDWNMAFQAAEAGLREAEDFLRTEVPPTTSFIDADGLYTLNSDERPDWVSDVTDDGNGAIQYDGNPSPNIGGALLPDVADQPRYFIEDMEGVRYPGFTPETGLVVGTASRFFRVTAIGFGGAVDDDGNPVTRVTLSSVYRIE